MSDKLTKAYLEIEKTSAGSKNKVLKCLYNPESYSITKSNSFQSAAAAADVQQTGSTSGAGGAPAHKMKSVEEQAFDGTEAATLSLNLLFDTTDDGDPVTKYTAKILDAMEPREYPGPKPAGKPGPAPKIIRPPRVKFGWGKETSWWSFITSATVTFEFFSSTGVPLRARVQLSLKQSGPDKAYTRQNPTSGTPMPHHVHRVQRGETLDRISARYYGDSTQWRTLAVANGVEDPLGLRPGMMLAIPELGA